MTREIDGMSVVMLGSFNPAIFQPEWLARYGLIATDEADAAEVQIVSGEVTLFSTDLFDVQVTHDQFVASTARVPSFGMLQDLVVGIFDRLRHTPVVRIGINRDVHFRMASQEAWHALGHRLVPPGLWSSFLKSPGMRTVVIQALRPDDRAGNVVLRVEPSLRVHPGIYIQQNDHFELDDKMKDAGQALDVLRSDWTSSLKRAEEAFSRIFDGN
jgi:hypothetical protein